MFGQQRRSVPYELCEAPATPGMRLCIKCETRISKAQENRRNHLKGYSDFPLGCTNCEANNHYYVHDRNQVVTLDGRRIEAA